MSYSHRGSSHDSSCFQDTSLYEKLNEMSDELYQKGFIIIGDSSYSIRSF